MADRPILFSAPMVRALLDGRKTQTRRVLKPQPETFPVDDAGTLCDVGLLHIQGDELPRVTTGCVVTANKVRFAIGDRLWVRESGIEFPGIRGGAGDVFRHDVPATPEMGVYWSRDNGGPGASYSVVGCPRSSALSGRAKVRPSIHMPRWASRLTLTVTDVRVEKLQDISEADALAEGLTFPDGMQWGSDPREAFWGLWDSINGPGAWAANPWVLALTFEVGRHNIDAEAPHG